MRKQKEVDIKKNIMKQVESGEVKIRPKIYFVLGWLFSLLGFVGSIVSIIYLSSMVKFLLKTHGPRGEYRWNELVSSLPIWFIPMVILSTVLGYFFFRKFDFSYKKNPIYLILGLLLAIVLTDYALGFFGFDEILFKQQNQNRQEMLKGRGAQRNQWR